jgi:hypothetical protein
MKIRLVSLLLFVSALLSASPSFCQAPLTSLPTQTFSTRPVNVHIVGRHAEGWYAGAKPVLHVSVVRHSWMARHFLGRQNSVTTQSAIPLPPAGVTGCHGQECVFSDNWIHNLRTTGGADWQANAMGATSSQPATATYIALTNDATAAAAGDCAAGSTTCTLTSEVTTNGLARHVATYSHTNATNTWSLSYTWTASGTQSVQKAGMFNASSSGTMVFESNFTQVNLVSTDTFTATWTVTF